MADKEINVEITVRETIKPSSSTPQHLQTLHISLFDQLAPDFYVPLLLFFPNSDPRNPVQTASDRSRLLKRSLSETLTRFYPLAGRLKGNISLDCCDEGAVFLEARVRNCASLSEILREPDSEEIRKLVPLKSEESLSGSGGGCFLAVQVSIFDCGSMALGLSVNHKIADASTLFAFVDTWAKTTRGALVMEPDVCAASELFPPVLELSEAYDGGVGSSPAVEFVPDKCATRRFVFEATKIEALRAELANRDAAGKRANGAGATKLTGSKTPSGPPRPTRVEAVSALLWKCAMEAASRSNNDDSSRGSVWCQVVNMRPRLTPPLGDNVTGNLGTYFAAKLSPECRHKVDPKTLIGEFKKGIRETNEELGKRKGGDAEEIKRKLGEFGKLMTEDTIDNYNCTSWCRFRFYDIDFGFGKPCWVSIASMGLKNCVLLMDSSDGAGIEAWLILRERDMPFFQANPQLLNFATFNPSVLT